MHKTLQNISSGGGGKCPCLRAPMVVIHTFSSGHFPRQLSMATNVKTCSWYQFRVRIRNRNRVSNFSRSSGRSHRDVQGGHIRGKCRAPYATSVESTCLSCVQWSHTASPGMITRELVLWESHRLCCPWLASLSSSSWSSLLSSSKLSQSKKSVDSLAWLNITTSSYRAPQYSILVFLYITSLISALTTVA